MTQPVLLVQGLEKSFAGKAILRSLSFQVEEGEVYGLIGPDGAGKTTTMRILCGLMHADAGNIQLLGFEIPKQRRESLGFMGYMPQQYSLYGDLSVQENLRFFAGMYGVKRAVLIERERRLLEIARLDRFRDRPAKALSGGMYKKLALSCALIHQPKLLILDEPTNGVDPISRRELWSFLYELVSEGVSVIVSTPYMDEAERCARVGLLMEGQLLKQESPARMKANFPFTVFELETDPLMLHAEKIRKEPGIRDVYLVGRRTHIITSHPDGYEVTLRKIIESHHLRVQSIQIIAPTFEDIFMSHTASPVEAERA